MRPLRLEVEGFSTFRDRVTLDFEGLDLVAFTGPTGAGKSSLIDAITFALYGSVARYDHVNKVAPVIHQLVTEARVRLDFGSGGRTYIVTRVVRRRTSRRGDADTATTREARLERLEADGTTTVLASEVRELNPAIESLLGLDFAQFNRTIVLPQGEFASFLRDDQANRDKLLQRLLDLGVYERMGQRARARAKETGVRSEMLIDQRRRLAPPDDRELAALVDREAALARFQDHVTTRVADLAALDARLDPLRERVLALDEAGRRLASVVVPDGVAGLDRDLDAALDRQATGQAALDEARRRRDEAQAALDQLPDKGDLVRAQSIGAQLAEARTDAAELAAEAAELAERLSGLIEAAAQSERDLAEAEAEVRAARQVVDASQWTATLQVGQPCPVCRQDVVTVPDHDAGAELERAEHRLAELAATARQDGRQVAKATERSRLVADEQQRQQERIDLLELQRSTGPVADDPELIAATLVAVDEAVQVARGAVEEVTRRERELADAVASAAELSRRVEGLRSDLVARRDAVADLGPPPSESGSLGADYQALADWAAERIEALNAERLGLADEGKRLKQERVELLDGLAAEGGRLGVAAEASELVAVVASARAEAAGRVADAERRRAEDAELASRIDELQAVKVLDEALGRHLRAGGFSSWLLEEALDQIVVKATVWLRELSGDQYSLVAGERSFAIIDHNNADERRDVRTLSGGETFLASLALALALSDSIAELAPVDAPQLDSMFLDEGFGTLDPATLDVVAGAMEELASAGRMIGVVTHVADLAERMPAQFQVRKGATTSTVELVGR